MCYLFSFFHVAKMCIAKVTLVSNFNENSSFIIVLSREVYLFNEAKQLVSLAA